MINRVGESRPAAVKASHVGSDNIAAASGTADRSAPAKAARAGSLVADIVARGAPIDSAKIASIKAAIAEGRYPLDPVRIAEGMIALGFGPEE